MSVRSKILVVGVVSFLAILLATPAMAATVGDYDGDGNTDFAVWRPSTGQWFIIPSSNPSTSIVQQWVLVGDIPVPGDYDGDGKTDFAVWRPSTGQWFVIPSSNPSTSIVQSWGLIGDIPVPGDYDGDGKTDFAVWRPSTGAWYIIPSSNPSNTIQQSWGTNGDIPVPGDYDGDGKTDFAVWRPSTGAWYIIPSSNPSNTIQQSWGTNGDIPVPGDYDGDGKTDFAVWRPSTGAWYIIPSSNPSNTIQQSWGLNGDIPVPGDYDGDKKTDFAVWRPSGGTWYIIPSSNTSNTIQQSWGTNGDIPIPGDYDGDGKTDFAVWRPSTGTWYIAPIANPSNTITQQWGTYCDTPGNEPIGATLPQGCGVWTFDTSDPQHNPQANSASNVSVGPVTPSQVDEIAFLAISERDTDLSAGWVRLYDSGTSGTGTHTGVYVNTYQTNRSINETLESESFGWATNILLFKGLWSLPLTQPITSVQISNNVVTCQAVNNFIVGTQVLINALNTGGLSNNTYTITGATPTSFQFSAALSNTGPNSENGAATNLPYLQQAVIGPSASGLNWNQTFTASLPSPLTAGSTVVAVLITGDNNAFGYFNTPG